MPRDENVLTVFVASPGDVVEERAALEDVIRELNTTWSKILGLRLELIRWETNVYPDFGEDVQDVINRQVGDDYDIFIGIMWAKYGTPTKRAGSGTEEEFQKAYKRYKEIGNLKIMFYFKDAPISPSKIDTEQLSKIAEFKRELGSKGGLYWEFKSTEEFQALLRVHLSLVIQEWEQNEKIISSGEPKELTKEQQRITIVNLDDEELGYLDYFENVNELLIKSRDILNRITQYISDLGTKTTQRAEEINQIKSLPKVVRLHNLKHIVNKSADDLEEFVARTDADLPLYSKALQDAFTSFGNMVSLSSEFGLDNPKDVNEALNSVSGLLSSMKGMIESITLLRSSIKEIPKMTVNQYRAKKKALNTLDNLLREQEFGLNILIEIEKALQNRSLIFLPK
jgi:hypothetical protein